MKDTEINFGPTLQHPTDYLVGAIRLYGLERVVTCLCQAVERLAHDAPNVVAIASARGLKEASLPDGVRVVEMLADGEAVLECSKHTPARDYVGMRPCPLCQGLQMIEDENLWARRTAESRWHLDDATENGFDPKDAA